MDNNLKTIESGVKLPVMQLIIAVCGVFACVFGLSLFNQHLLMTFSMPLRAVLLVVTQWILFLAPGILMVVSKETLESIGLKKDKLPRQIAIGVLLALAMSLVLTLLPILFGFKDMIGNASYNETWKFVYEFVYAIFGVALAEELIFRGYIFNKLLEIKNSRWFAIVVSSLLFGLFHIFNRNIIQVIVTAVLGFLFCMFREKIRGCTLISLIVAHGIYDALIVLLVSIL